MGKTEHTEIEARWVNLDQEVIESKLKERGATHLGNFLYREWIFWNDSWWSDRRRLRVRTNGEKTWLTYKANLSAQYALDNTQEVEIEVSSPEDAVKIVELSDVQLRRQQEKKIHRYQLGEAFVELNFWPKIPMVLEIEAPSKEGVKQAAQELGLSWDDALYICQLTVHKEIYGVDLVDEKTYIFE